MKKIFYTTIRLDQQAVNNVSTYTVYSLALKEIFTKFLDFFIMLN
jgi:hypothetical protein